MPVKRWHVGEPTNWRPVHSLDQTADEAARGQQWIDRYGWRVLRQQLPVLPSIQVARYPATTLDLSAEWTPDDTPMMRSDRIDVQRFGVGLSLFLSPDIAFKLADAHNLTARAVSVPHFRTWPLPNLHDIGAMRRFLRLRGRTTSKRQPLSTIRKMARARRYERQNVRKVHVTGGVTLGYAAADPTSKTIYFWPNVATNPAWWPLALAYAAGGPFG